MESDFEDGSEMNAESSTRNVRDIDRSENTGQSDRGDNRHLLNLGDGEEQGNEEEIRGLREQISQQGVTENVEEVHLANVSRQLEEIEKEKRKLEEENRSCLLYTSPSPRDRG